MEVNLQCDIQLINDAIAQGNINIVCEIFQKFRTILNDNGKVCIYEDFLPPVSYRQNLVFDKLDDFNNWVRSAFPRIDC